MTLTVDQQRAVSMAMDGADLGGKVMVLSGFAGCGKTYALKEVVRQLPGTIIIAPTGTAARRATIVTGTTSITLHKWRFQPKEDANGKLHFVPLPIESPRGGRCVERPPSGLLVVEEGSMVTRHSWSMVMDAVRKLGISVLVVGDGFQLNPVDPGSTTPFNLMAEDFKCDASVTLVEPQRTAADHPIFRIATALRRGKGPDDWRAAVRQMPVAPRRFAQRLAQLRGDGVEHVGIVHSNGARMRANHDVRRLIGRRSVDLEPGEPALVRRSSDDVGVVNGEIIPAPEWGPVHKDKYGGKWTRFVANGVECITSVDAMMGREEPPTEKAIAITESQTGFKYVHMQPGYAVTCHAAQGNEWAHVVVELGPSLKKMGELERARWCYTSWTRARERAEVVAS